jgi:hypothetical protein
MPESLLKKDLCRSDIGLESLRRYGKELGCQHLNPEKDPTEESAPWTTGDQGFKQDLSTFIEPRNRSARIWLQNDSGNQASLDANSESSMNRSGAELRVASDGAQCKTNHPR